MTRQQSAPGRSPRTRVLVLGGVVAALLAVAFQSGLGEILRDPERLVDLYRDAGPWGPFVFVLLFAFLEPVGVPGALFFVPAAIAWPPWQAFLLTWLGAVGAACNGFAFARWVARDWVADRLPERLRRLDARMGERPLVTVLVVRLLFFLAPPAHWALGLSRVGFGPYLVGSMLGYLPGVALVVLASKGIYELLADAPFQVWMVLGLVVVAALAVRSYLSRRRRLPMAGESTS